MILFICTVGAVISILRLVSLNLYFDKKYIKLTKYVLPTKTFKYKSLSDVKENSNMFLGYILSFLIFVLFSGNPFITSVVSLLIASVFSKVSYLLEKKK